MRNERYVVVAAVVWGAALALGACGGKDAKAKPSTAAMKIGTIPTSAMMTRLRNSSRCSPKDMERGSASRD